MSKLYGRPTSSLNWPETLALAQLRQAFPDGKRQEREMPVPGKPGRYYPVGTKERLEEKQRRHRRLAPI